MSTPEILKDDDSQAVQIPRELSLDDVLAIFATLPDDFMQEGRNDPPPQKRDFDQ